MTLTAKAMPISPINRGRIEALQRAAKFLEDGEPDDAWDIVNAILMEDPNDPRALMAAGAIQEKAMRYAVSYSFSERAVHLAPNISEVWMNFGRASDILYLTAQAELAYKKALSLARNDRQKAAVLMNMGGMYLTAGKWKEAEDYSRQALALNPTAWKAKGNFGMACLAQRKWPQGWENFGAVLGSDVRKRVQYGKEPEWDGTKGKTVIVYGEQGLGDEVSFASIIPDAIRDCKKVIIDCDKRLAPLFARSFPQASVYGTRTAKAGDGQRWDEKDHEFDYSVPMGGLGRFYRQTDADFPGTPYLIPDPKRTLMWNALFERQRPAIGIAWTGGMQWTAAQFRKWAMNDLDELLRFPAHWVSLQYKDAAAEIKGTPIVQYPYATLTKDYDDTAALVAALDLVICMQTGVAELCGAIGKECWVFIPTYSQWRYGIGEDMPWYKSVKVFRQREDGSWPLDEALRLLKLRYAR